MNRTASALLIALAAVGCSESSDPAAPIDSATPTEINDYVDRLPDWEIPDDTEDPPLDLEPEEPLEGEQLYRCEVVEYDLRENFDDLIVVGSTANSIKPGMLLQGNGVRDGSLAPLSLPRSPISISANLALDTPSRRIENPSSSSIQDAIASIQREADTRLGELDVIPAVFNYSNTTAYSFQHAMMSAGISLSYSTPFASAGMDAAFTESSTVRSHSVVVRMMQPMYTISFAHDQIPTPADFFSPDLTAADFNRQQELGNLGPDNLPCLVESVTYGRMMMFIITSTEVQTSRELELAVEASYLSFSGSGEVSTEQEQLIQNSTIRIQSFGGLQEDAFEAVRNADWSAFFRPVPASVAVPLSYKIVDMKTRAPAVIGDATKYTVKTCEPVTNFRFTVDLEGIDILSGCESYEAYDIEIFITAQSNEDAAENYTLLHRPPSGPFLPEDLAGLERRIIFDMEAGPEAAIEIFAGVYNLGGSSSGWDQRTRLEFPFDFESNPRTLTHAGTMHDTDYLPCNLRINYSIQREINF